MLIEKKVISSELVIASGAIIGIVIGLIFQFASSNPDISAYIYIAVLVLGGTPLVFELLKKLIKGQFGSDLLAGIAIVTAALLHEYLAGAFVVLMLSGGEALERFALSNASSALRALAKRMPNIAHRRIKNGYNDISLDQVALGDHLVILPHEVSPTDGVVIDGRSTMDESYLTGEPFMISKIVGATVISGALNGDSSLTIEATKLPKDSRYSKVVEVMKRAEEERPELRRLGDILGAWYTPLAVFIAAAAWIYSNEATRFLAVLVIATPCPLLIAIPIAIIGGISLSAKRGIIIRDPGVMEQLPRCDTVILDKTGTLTLGIPIVTAVHCYNNFSEQDVISLAGSLERYSKHPLAQAVLLYMQAHDIVPSETEEVGEKPGEGLSGKIRGKTILITSRKKMASVVEAMQLPALSGLECLVVVDGVLAGIIQFHDEPRKDSRTFISHLHNKHRVKRVMIISGDRESEVRFLAEQVGISEIYSSQTPEQKVALVKQAYKSGKTLYIGDGINDAPALASAHVGIAMGKSNDVAAEAAGAIILDSSLRKLDELLHISIRMKRIALQSAFGGMILSVAGMMLASAGLLSPVAGAIAQEVIDLIAVLNALRSVYEPAELTDMD